MNIEQGEGRSSELQRSPEEAGRMRETMQFLARAFSGSFGVRVLPGQGWACLLPEAIREIRLSDINLDKIDPKLLQPDRLSYPEEDLTIRSEEYLFGVLRHEIAELKFSRFRDLLEGQKMAQAEEFRPEDFHTLFNATNDCRVNNLEAAGSETARENIATYVREDLGPFFEKITDAPAPLQYAGLVMGNWARVLPGIENIEKLQGKITNPQVLAAYSKTAQAVERSSQVGSAPYYHILTEEIWPTFKELIEKYLEEETQNQFNQEQEEKKQAGTKGEGEPENFEDLPDEQKEQYRQRVREKLSQAEEEFNQQIGSRLIETYRDENGQLQIRFKEIPQEDIEKAEIEEQKLSQEEQVRLQQLQKEAEERARLLQAQATALRERKLGLTEGEQQIYNQHRRQVEKYIQQLVREIERTFPPKEKLGWVSGRPRGLRLEPRRLAREVATKHGHFFQAREMEEARLAVFTLLIDISGSMYNKGRIPAALESAIMMAEAFSRKEIPFEILVFAGHPLELKKFEEDYKGIAKRKMIGILRQEQGHDFYGHTDSGYSLDWAAKRLERKSLEDKIPGCLLMVTDGEPYPIAGHDGTEWELRRIAEGWQRTFPVVGIGIGSEIAPNIQNYFGKEFSVAEEDVGQLPKRLLQVLQNQFARMREIE